MDDYYRELQEEMERQRDEKILDYELEHERKIGIQAIDMELDRYYSDLSPQELAELKHKKIRELDIELINKRRKMEMEMERDRYIEQMKEEMEEILEEMRDSMYEDDDYPY